MAELACGFPGNLVNYPQVALNTLHIYPSNMPITPTNQTPKTAPSRNDGPVLPNINKGKIIIIAVIIIAAIAAVWKMVPSSKSEKIIEGLIKDAQKNTQTAEALKNAANELIQNGAEEKIPPTPEEKFATAEAVEITNGEHNTTVRELGKAIEEVFGKYKVTGYTKGYMGMNSGSGVVQYTLAQALSVKTVDTLYQTMEKQGFTVAAIDKHPENASIMAKKGEYIYTLSYNEGEQEITAIIEKKTSE